jgi:hypothetical protein
MALSADELRRLARLGAVARLQQLHQEEAAIRAEFPELFGRGRRRDAPEGDGSNRDQAPAPARAGSRRRRGMSAAARRAASARMRRYWAERRKAKAAR